MSERIVTLCCAPTPDRPPHTVLGPTSCGWPAVGPDPDPEISFRRTYCAKHLVARQAEYDQTQAELMYPGHAPSTALLNYRAGREVYDTNGDLW